jgi:hypothetical protein
MMRMSTYFNLLESDNNQQYLGGVGNDRDGVIGDIEVHDIV